MFYLLIMSFLMSSFAALAGQHGSGGNICVGLDESTYKAFDELKYPGRASGTHLPGSAILTGGKLPDYQIFSGMREGDLITSRASKNAEKKFLSLAARDEVLSRIFMTYFSLLKDVYVADFDFNVYAEVGSFSSELCRKGTLRSVILTRPTGAILISSSLWSQLSSASQEVILIHETLRIAQLFSDWFDISNDELEELTMRLYSEDIYSFLSHDFYQDFKKDISEEGSLSLLSLIKEIKQKDQIFSRILIWEGANEAFKLQLSTLQKAAILGNRAKDIYRAESEKMKALKENRNYLQQVEGDLLRQFGPQGL